MNSQPMSTDSVVGADFGTGVGSGGLAFFAAESVGDMAIDGTDFLAWSWRFGGGGLGASIAVTGFAVVALATFGDCSDALG